MLEEYFITPEENCDGCVKIHSCYKDNCPDKKCLDYLDKLGCEGCIRIERCSNEGHPYEGCENYSDYGDFCDGCKKIDSDDCYDDGEDCENYKSDNEVHQACWGCAEYDNCTDDACPSQGCDCYRVL